MCSFGGEKKAFRSRIMFRQKIFPMTLGQHHTTVMTSFKLVMTDWRTPFYRIERRMQSILGLDAVSVNIFL
jgi:hypothetical protein